MNLLGDLLRLGLGIGLAALLEYRDSSLRTDDEVVSTLALPVLAMIPLMENEAMCRTRKRRKWALALTTAAILTVGSAGLIWKLTL